ncbi:UDP-N-acetylglucosamine--N-acetylmuramyl-(pentapeptide) pyrophosphoryl-undecaprenol N-acetylglucosamine transferase [candidate division WOR-3 bacterium]|nr:UDP-N-acetylglucosamine--N-acetylmuramyl-(pentapeptide) pyrophosphoryl-undecaprenol N-acetylglucosamine transferase [candidate division WOR-3 bacterium]
MRRSKLIIAVGATGGHIYPALACAEELKIRCELVFLGSERGLGEKLLKSSGFRFEKIKSNPWAGKTLVEKLRALFSFISGTIMSLKIMSREKPFAVFATGSFTTVPVLAACVLSALPFFIFEPDVEPGMTTKYFGVKAKKIFLSYEDTREHLPKTHRTLFTGTPVRARIGKVPFEEAREKFGFSKNDKVILVFGGSQGSAKIEKTFFEMCEKYGVPENAKIIASSGKFSQGLFEKCGQRILCMNYIEDMPSAYACADTVVARAGAMTVAELITAKKFSVLIPLPIARGHQEENARQLEKLGWAIVLKENELDAPVLYEAVKTALAKNLDKKENYHRMKNSARLIAREICGAD